MGSKPVLGSALLLGALLCGTGARAQPNAAQKETARGLMAQGRELRERGDVSGALTRFRAADAMMGVPTTGFELGSTQVQLGRLLEAHETLGRVLSIAQGPDDPEPFNEARIKARALDQQADYENAGFPLIYKYDLYLALGLNSVAASALTEFKAIKNARPYPDTYWFKNWFYPVWRDHGHAQVFANYETLLQRHFLVGADRWTPDMSYGQYFHFMSGAAGVDLVPLARTAFHWDAEFDDELAAAKVDFPDIEY